MKIKIYPHLIQVFLIENINDNILNILKNPTLKNKTDFKKIDIMSHVNNIDDSVENIKKYLNFENQYNLINFFIEVNINFNKESRKEIINNVINVSKKHGYVINIYESSNYNTYLNQKTNKQILKNLHKDFPNSNVHNFYNLKDVHEQKENLFFEMMDLELFNKTTQKINKDINYLFIGDVHEHVQGLHTLLTEVNKNTPLNNIQIVFLGDLIDKGNQTEEMILYIDNLCKSLKHKPIFIAGNHEAYVVRRLEKKISPISHELEIENFNSVFTLEKNEILKSKISEIYHNSYPFLKVVTENNVFFATHAPCSKNVLGKFTENAKRDQRNFRFDSREIKEMQEEISFLNNSSQKLGENIFHIFGHVAHNMSILENNNRIWLDTGAVYGNKLSSLLIDSKGKKEFIQVNTKPLVNIENIEEKLFYLPFKNEFKIK